MTAINITTGRKKEEGEKGYSRLQGVVSWWVCGCDGGHQEQGSHKPQHR